MNSKYAWFLLPVFALLIGLSACETVDPKRKGPTDIRIKNGSEFLMEEVVVGPHNFGDIQAGATTAYREFDVAYDYAYVRFRVDTLVFSLVPIDFVGEEPLGKGQFTHTLELVDVASRMLRIMPSKD